MADNTSNPQAAQPAAPATPPSAPGAALSCASKIEELADRLTACADAIHERVMRDIHSYPGDVPESEKAAARALLDSEQVLRERADGMYQDAAACIVGSLGQSQQHVIQLTTDAAAKIQTITRIGDAVSLAARLVNVATTVIYGPVYGEGIALMTALNALQTQLGLIAAHNPPTAPVASSTPPTSA